MAVIKRVTNPLKVVTDELALKRLAEQGIDKNFVEFWHDYAPRSMGKEYSPYAKFYRDLKSGKRLMVVSGLPKVDAMGRKIDPAWLYDEGRYCSKVNLFAAIVDGERVNLACLSDQPDGTKEGARLTYRPQLFVGGIELTNSERPVLLADDPTNKSYHENTLEWSYGNVCKRRIRIVEGRFRERWLFASNPHHTVSIKHNLIGDLGLKLGHAYDAEGNSLKVTVIGDEEVIEAREFDKVTYPVEIGASATFYPDTDVETSSVDGYVSRMNIGDTWAQLRDGIGTGAGDSTDYLYITLWAQNGNNYREMYRAIALFDTSPLTNNCRVLTAIATFYGQHKLDGLSISPTINVYASAPASDTALIPADFSAVGEVAYCDTAVTYAGWNSGSPGSGNDFAFNATGILAVSKIGITKLSLREASYDGPNSDPGVGGSATVGSYFNAWASDKGAGYKPKLVVTYVPLVNAVWNFFTWG